MFRHVFAVFSLALWNSNIPYFQFFKLLFVSSNSPFLCLDNCFLLFFSLFYIIRINVLRPPHARTTAVVQRVRQPSYNVYGGRRTVSISVIYYKEKRLSEQTFAQIAHRIPNRKPTCSYNGKENNKHVEIMNAYRVSINNVTTVGIAHSNQSELLL